MFNVYKQVKLNCILFVFFCLHIDERSQNFTRPIKSLAVFVKVTALCSIDSLPPIPRQEPAGVGCERTDGILGNVVLFLCQRAQLVTSLPGGIKGRSLDAALCSQGEAD